MMEWIDLIRVLHVLGACVLIGTGSGIAFFMVMAHRSGDAKLIAGVGSIVVIADWVFTASAAIAQPITGLLLIHHVGWSLSDGWVWLSLVLYGVIGACWLPVVVIQMQLRDLAVEASTQNAPLPPRYHKLFRIWFALGVPAFTAIVALLWLMVVRPDF